MEMNGENENDQKPQSPSLPEDEEVTTSTADANTTTTTSMDEAPPPPTTTTNDGNIFQSETVEVKSIPGEEIFLRGIWDSISCNFTGKWGIGERAFQPNGFVGDFAYKKEKSMELPSDGGYVEAMAMSGYFMMHNPLARGKFKKHVENNITMAFKPRNATTTTTTNNNNNNNHHNDNEQEATEEKNDIMDVDGSGNNIFGRFVLRGTFNKSTGALNLERNYFAPPLTGTVVSSLPGLNNNNSNNNNNNSSSSSSNGSRSLVSNGKVSTPNGAIRSPSNGVTAHHAGEDSFRPERQRRPPVHFASEEESEQSKEASRLMAPVVSKLLKFDKFGVFHVPVDPAKYGLANYFDVIKNPMDLGTVKSKLSAHEYKTVEECVKDIKLTFDNAMLYNPPLTPVHELAKKSLVLMGDEVQRILQRRASSRPSVVQQSSSNNHHNNSNTSHNLKKDQNPKRHLNANNSDDDDDFDGQARRVAGGDIKTPRSSRGKKPRTSAPDQIGSSTDEEVRALREQVKSMSELIGKQMQQFTQFQTMNMGGAGGVEVDLLQNVQDHSLVSSIAPLVSRQKSTHSMSSSLSNNNKGSGQSRGLSYQEKRQLGQDIRCLPPEKISRVIEIIQENGGQLGGNDDEVEIDIDILETPALKELQKYCKSVLRAKKV